MSLERGARLGPYEIQSPLTAGRMGKFVVRHPSRDAEDATARPIVVVLNWAQGLPAN